MGSLNASEVRRLEHEIGELQHQIESLARIVSVLVQRIPEPEQSEILRLVSNGPKESRQGS